MLGIHCTSRFCKTWSTHVIGLNINGWILYVVFRFLRLLNIDKPRCKRHDLGHNVPKRTMPGRFFGGSTQRSNIKQITPLLASNHGLRDRKAWMLDLVLRTGREIQYGEVCAHKQRLAARASYLFSAKYHADQPCFISPSRGPTGKLGLPLPKPSRSRHTARIPRILSNFISSGIANTRYVLNMTENELDLDMGLRCCPEVP